MSRSREGAWIEILQEQQYVRTYRVAPARERGLKCQKLEYLCKLNGRSREGAWIEITIRKILYLWKSASLPRGSVD